MAVMIRPNLRTGVFSCPWAVDVSPLISGLIVLINTGLICWANRKHLWEPPSFFTVLRSLPMLPKLSALKVELQIDCWPLLALPLCCWHCYEIGRVCPISVCLWDCTRHISTPFIVSHGEGNTCCAWRAGWKGVHSPAVGTKLRCT